MRKLWNRPALPVWSVSSVDEQGVPNCNIVTYATSISLQPKLQLVALYHGTQTLQNVVASRHLLLQLLTVPLCGVVRICGKQSGKEVDKLSKLTKRYEIGWWGELPYFAAAAGFMELQVQTLHETDGDHTLAICAVQASQNRTDAPVLTTDVLRERRMIR